ncbi:hypothetical protein HanIR_Chr17g0885961 [Helianthus annuus]|nr:hypothetical protein HanIR_Chr17g0885961 [Helianthus annuus]
MPLHLLLYFYKNLKVLHISSPNSSTQTHSVFSRAHTGDRSSGYLLRQTAPLQPFILLVHRRQPPTHPSSGEPHSTRTPVNPQHLPVTLG